MDSLIESWVLITVAEAEPSGLISLSSAKLEVVVALHARSVLSSLRRGTKVRVESVMLASSS